MSRPNRTFDELAALARLEATPGVDVADSVMRSLGERDYADNRPFYWLTAAAAISAACMALYLAAWADVATDPLQSVFMLSLEFFL
ncbi:MAG: hypothetical protein GC154_04835 [bacterium]|nr:hypothetical protein [bacterium]